ncbi:hypothetical protein TSUD_97940 [Trifolium subterraneum]|uniref:Uncharacterized protein n=1 Tax=Trifolium subterraneum TaxID=3900 RepID=A0A2Z6N8X9_TRISU|nr:hypothetical protein TSUD_97940 [Trifolium subterraneum]
MMSRPGSLTCNRVIAATQYVEPFNLHSVAIIPELVNTQHNNQVPQLATQTSVPVNNIFYSIHASLSLTTTIKLLPKTLNHVTQLKSTYVKPT